MVRAAAPIRGGLSDARTALARHFGYAGFRPAQVKVLGPLLAGHNVLAVLPTGAGKSLCYQLPGVMAAGLTIVVSPLIALMQDQVATLDRRGIRAAYLSSVLEPAEQRGVMEGLYAGAVRILYCAPERLESLVRELRARRVRPALLAIDEAHCIVEWGNEFRPAYRRLGAFRYLLGNPLTIALTGTATPLARREILTVLRLSEATVVVESFDRPNLAFLVRRVRDDRERFAIIRQLVVGETGSAILYTPTRRLAELAARALLRVGISAAPYHAGLTPDTRRRTLIDFLEDRVGTVVATTAFGMGIDKPTVRLVAHWGPARTLEAYYQEAGRAGRDGGPAQCVLLWTPRDLAWNGCDDSMRHYVEGRCCRRRLLLEHLGEKLNACSGCDVCRR